MRLKPLAASVLMLSLSGCMWAQAPAISVPATTALATAPATQPMRLDTPVVLADKKEVQVPTALFNQRLAGWLEVALCGRSSDFLHETLLCIRTPQKTMTAALLKAGFVPADVWADNFDNFQLLRGQRVAVLVEITQNDKTETYLADELMGFSGWGTNLGVYGMVFKGEPTGGKVPELVPGVPLPAPATAPAGTQPMTVSEIMYRDDPQVALTFKGLQHISRSFMDHPLAYDDGQYGLPNYVRNTKLLTPELYESNFTVPMTLRLVAVNEEQLLTLADKHLRNRGMAKQLARLLPQAKAIDTYKAAYLKLRQDPADRPGKGAQLTLLALQAAGGYAALDQAWLQIMQDDITIDPEDKEQEPELRANAKTLLRQAEHKSGRMAGLIEAAQAEYDLALAAPASAADADVKAHANKVRLLQASAQAGQARALLHEAEMPLEHWTREAARLDPKTDPRKDWIAHVQAQVELQQARQAFAKASLAVAEARRTDSITPTLERALARGFLAMTRAEIQLRLANVAFEMTKLGEMEDAETLAKYQKEKEGLLTNLAGINQALEQLSAATQPK